MDTNYGYGQTPITLRDKYHEAHDLITRAWTEPEPFAFNGKFTQLRYVNIWPRPIQKPHPPIWVPGGGSIETWEWVTEQDYLFAYLSYGGYKRAKTIMDGFWNHVESVGKESNPYQAGFLQFVAVSEDDAQAQEDYGEAGEYFYERCLHVYRGFAEAPGYRSLRSVESGLSGVLSQGSGGQNMYQPGRGWKDYVAEGNIIAGSPESVTEQVRHLIKSLRIGHLMLLLQFGNMPRDKAMKNTRLFAEKVMPNLRDLWSEYEDRWWIKPLANERQAKPIGAK
jgi:alkanesulfonate monooxygenase SsuD/methylene tetrahydromethanopterin reductase-like flavin-dependent oxidoreductase (luciferase family)